MSATISEMQLLGIFDIALNAAFPLPDVTRSDSIQRAWQNLSQCWRQIENDNEYAFERHLNYFR